MPVSQACIFRAHSQLIAFFHRQGAKYTPFLCLLPITGMESTGWQQTAYPTREERKTNTVQKYFLLPLKVPCNLVYAVPYTC